LGGLRDPEIIQLPSRRAGGTTRLDRASEAESVDDGSDGSDGGENGDEAVHTKMTINRQHE